MVRIVKSREHAGADHFDGLDEVGADDVIARQTEASDDQALEQLAKEVFAAFEFGCGGRFCRERLGV